MMRFTAVLLATLCLPSAALAATPDALDGLSGPVTADWVASQPAPASFDALRVQAPIRAAAWQAFIAVPELARAASDAQVLSTRAGGARLIGAPHDPRVAVVHLERALHGSDADDVRLAHARAGVALLADDALLQAFLDEAPPPLRAAALAGLARSTSVRSGQLVAAALTDADPTVREVAASVLGRRPDAVDHLQALTLAAVDASPDVRRLAVRALGWHGTSAQGPVVAARLSDPQAPVRLAALRALERLDVSQAGARAASLVDDADPSVRRAARELAGR